MVESTNKQLLETNNAIVEENKQVAESSQVTNNTSVAVMMRHAERMDKTLFERFKS